MPTPATRTSDDRPAQAVRHDAGHPRGDDRPLARVMAGDRPQDVVIAPKKTMVSFRRSKQFACFTPSSAKRAELGVALRGDPPTERLRLTNGMTSHAVWIADPAEIDAEVVAWVRAAYERS